MNQRMVYVVLDVHKETIAVACGFRKSGGPIFRNPHAPPRRRGLTTRA